MHTHCADLWRRNMCIHRGDRHHLPHQVPSDHTWSWVILIKREKGCWPQCFFFESLWASPDSCRRQEGWSDTSLGALEGWGHGGRITRACVFGLAAPEVLWKKAPHQGELWDRTPSNCTISNVLYLAWNQYINNLPGFFSCIRVGANIGATCIRTDMNSLKNLANMRKLFPQKYFLYSRECEYRPRMYSCKKLIPQEILSACIGFVLGGGGSTWWKFRAPKEPPGLKRHWTWPMCPPPPQTYWQAPPFHIEEDPSPALPPRTSPPRPRKKDRKETLRKPRAGVNTRTGPKAMSVQHLQATRPMKAKQL